MESGGQRQLTVGLEMEYPVSQFIACVATVGKFATASSLCGLLGSVAGAILGGLAGLPFFPPGGPEAGLLFGAIGGLVAGIIGGAFAGSPGFRIGGLIGVAMALICMPFVALFWLIPPILALVVSFSFGLYLDKQVQQATPNFFLAWIVRAVLGKVALYPTCTKRTAGAISVLLLVLTAALILQDQIRRLTGE